MNSLSDKEKVYNLLSIGQRGVGKTVFLAGSYAELHIADRKNSDRRFWFDCKNSQVQTNIENILSYIARTGEYPPPTMKITDFNFSLKNHSETLCDFCWKDMPGEFCNIDNPEFQKVVLNSHGCCLFIDAYALIQKSANEHALENIIAPAIRVADLLSLNRTKYPFALILTKCDLVEADSLNREHLLRIVQRLSTFLAVRSNYKLKHLITLYSHIPIVSQEGVSMLNAKEAGESVMLLVNEFRKVNNLLISLSDLLPRFLRERRGSKSSIALQGLADPPLDLLEAQQKVSVGLPPITLQLILISTLVIVGLLVVIVS